MDEEDGKLVANLEMVVEALKEGQVHMQVNQVSQGHPDLEEGLHVWVGGQEGYGDTVEHASENEEEVEYVCLWGVSTNVQRQFPVLPVGLFVIE